MITEELGLDVSPAQASIDALGADLQQVAQQFQVSLADALTTLQGIEIAPAVDVSTVSGEVQAALQEGAATPVQLALDLGIAEEQVLALGDIQVPPVPIDADTAPAQDKIDQLTGSSSAAKNETDGLGHSVEALGAGAALSRGEVGGLGDALGGIAPEAAAAAAGIAIVAGSTKEFFGLAIDAASAERRFNEQLGASADLVTHIKVGNLDTDLKTLANSLGTTEAALQASDAKLALLGNSSGTAQEQVAQVVAQVNALAARSVAANPSLGSVADVTDRMSIALTRGGRFAAQLGISLNTAEIAARAQQIATARGSDSVEQFDKIAAGAAISVEKLGGSLKESIAQGTKDPVIQLAALKAQLEETLTTIAKPLIAPVFDLLKAGEPIIASVATVFSTLDQALIPIASHVVAAIQPLFVGLAAGVTALSPALISLGNNIGKIADGFLPLLQLAGQLLALFGSGLGTVIQVVSDALGGMTGPIAHVIEGLVALKLAIVLLNADPIVLLATAVAAVTIAIGGMNEKVDAFAQLQAKVASSAATVDSALFNNAGTLADLNTALADGSDGWVKFLGTQSEFAKDNQAGTALRAIGEDAETLRGQLLNGAQGLQDFVAAGIQAGQIKIKIDGVEQTADQVKNLSDLEGRLVSSNGKIVTSGGAVVTAFNNQQLAIEHAAEAKVNELALSGQVSKAQIQESIDRQKAAGATATYSQVLQDLARNSPAALEASNAQTAALQAQNKQWTDLADKVSKAQQEAAKVIQAQNLEADSARAVAKAQRDVADAPLQVAAAQRAEQSASLDLVDAQRALHDLSSTYLSDLNAQKSANFQLTDAVRALQELQNQPAKDANALTGANLDLQSAQLQVIDSTKKLADTRADPKASPEDVQKAEIELARAQLQVSESSIRVQEAQAAQGQEAENLSKAQLAVQQAQLAVDAANQKVQQHSEAVIRANIAIADANDRVHTSGNNAADAMDAEAKAFENLATVISNQEIVLANSVQRAADSGFEIAHHLTAGLVQSLRDSGLTGDVNDAGSQIGQVLSAAMNGALGINSPSKVAIEIGQRVGQGLVIGLNSAQDQVANSGTKLGSSVIGGLSVAGPKLNAAGASPALAVGVPGLPSQQPGGLVVQVFVTPPKDMTPAQAKSLGDTIGDAVVVKTQSITATVHSA